MSLIGIMPAHPITFSIAQCKLVDSVPEKKQLMSPLIPGVPSTYIYTTEAEYYQQYRDSFFATTTKKGGWDCMRHYEIMACGCIPYFPGIEQCPPNTMGLLPKTMILEGNALYRAYKDKPMDDYAMSQCKYLADRLLAYTKNILTTRKMAEYILITAGAKDAKRILYLSQDPEPDYLRCVTLQGFKEYMGAACHDYPKIPHIYKDAGIDYTSKYGKGFSYTNLVDQSLHDAALDLTVEQDIFDKKYDLIIYGSFHRGLPFYGKVMSSYPPEKVVLICGEDDHQCIHSQFTAMGHHVFVREL